MSELCGIVFSFLFICSAQWPARQNNTPLLSPYGVFNEHHAGRIIVRAQVILPLVLPARSCGNGKPGYPYQMMRK